MEVGPNLDWKILEWPAIPGNKYDISWEWILCNKLSVNLTPTMEIFVYTMELIESSTFPDYIYCILFQ